MNREQLQRLAQERAEDAQALLAAGRWSGAYYLAGYSVECALKACVAKLTNQYDFPDKDRASKCYTHNLENLVEIAGLRKTRDEDGTANPTRLVNWVLLKRWNEQSRYQVWDEREARSLVSAVTDTLNGVLPWITARW